jgi:hypothetical protein
MASNSEETDYKIFYEDWNNKNESLVNLRNKIAFGELILIEFLRRN